MNKFPINTATSCQFKWTWSVLYLHQGTTNSCHRCKRWKIDLDNFDSFHNHPGKLGDRQKMLEGQWPGNGCEYCQSVEQAGGQSERKSYVNDQELAPPELATDPTAIEVTPRVLEVYFKNLCNLSCLYCSPVNSSAIEAEFRRFGPIPGVPQYGFDPNNYDPNHPTNEYVKKFWSWMEKNSNELRVFAVLGGEPLYHTEFDDCLDFFDKYPNPLLNFRIFSNLQHDPVAFKNKVGKVDRLVREKKISSFDVVCSIDCWGKESEFVRMGLDMETWETNFRTLVESDININVHMSATPLSVFTADQLVEKVLSYSENKSIDISMNTVVKPTQLSPYIFGYHLVPYVERIIEKMPPSNYHNVFVTVTSGIINKMKNLEPDLVEIAKFVKYMDVLDFRRKKNWRETFPVLADLCKQLLDK